MIIDRAIYVAVEDAGQAHQRTKLERYGDTLFIVLRAAHYVDVSETVEFAELHAFAGPDFVITVRHGEGSELSRLRSRSQDGGIRFQPGPDASLHALLDRVVDDYEPVVAGPENDIDDIDEIELEVFRWQRRCRSPDSRTYELTREAIDFQRATKPLAGIASALIPGADKHGVSVELQDYLRDVQDHAIHVQEQVAAFRELLQNVLGVNLAVVGLQQNEDVKAMTQASIEQNDEAKRISAWAAILFGPTLIGTIDGMNFDNMPELHWQSGYLLSSGLLLLTAYSIYYSILVKRRGG